jgi:hypothetical protein
VQRTVAGWLDAIAAVEPHLSRLRACAPSVCASGITEVELLGMVGSSLEPEVLHAVVGVALGFLRFRVLDSVDSDAIRSATAHPGSSLSVIAGESGSTIEPNVLLRRSARSTQAAGDLDVGSRSPPCADAAPIHWRSPEVSGAYSPLRSD